NFRYAVVNISVNTVTTDINQDSELVSYPSEFKLEQNYPNPFNPTTTIKYQIPELGLVTLKVYDILGREVKELVNAEKPVGTYEVVFNAKSLPSGIYVYELQAGDYIETKKLVLLK
ncbi:MAG: T9SS type A sorting domain-containing protein, partial [Bacteroidetes bacterium]|nr:T9SS type A sorting domain-containing protein [Bacteroidota bacterium]